MFDRVDWSKRGQHMLERHAISVRVAQEVLADPNRVVIDPDYNSATGQGVRIVGYSSLEGAVVSLIVMEVDGIAYGVNGWRSNEKDRRIYREAEDDGQD